MFVNVFDERGQTRVAASKHADSIMFYVCNVIVHVENLVIGKAKIPEEVKRESNFIGTSVFEIDMQLNDDMSPKSTKIVHQPLSWTASKLGQFIVQKAEELVSSDSFKNLISINTNIGSGQAKPRRKPIERINLVKHFNHLSSDLIFKLTKGFKFTLECDTATRMLSSNADKALIELVWELFPYDGCLVELASSYSEEERVVVYILAKPEDVEEIRRRVVEAEQEEMVNKLTR